MHACAATGEHPARHLVLGTGTPPHIPAALPGPRRRRRAQLGYLQHRDALRAKRSITVVGSGQSAAEIYQDLLADIDRHGYRLNWVTRSPRFFPLEYTKLTLEMTSPDYVDYFHALPEQRRDRPGAAPEGLFKGINADLINDIFDLLYAKSIDGPVPTRLLTNTALAPASDWDRRRTASGCATSSRTATSRSTPRAWCWPPATATRCRRSSTPIRDRIRWDAHGRFDVARNYSIDHAGREIFVQNAEHAHAQLHVARPGHGARTATPGSSASCSAGSSTRSRSRIALPAVRGPARRHLVSHDVTAATTRARRFAAARRSTRTRDAALLHGWVTHPKAAFWMMQDADVGRRRGRVPARSRPTRTTTPSWALHDGRPASSSSATTRPRSNSSGLYHASSRATSACTSSCAPTDTPIHGFTRAVITTVMDVALRATRHPAGGGRTGRAQHGRARANAAVGFTVVGARSEAPDKQALLSICTRDRVRRSPRRGCPRERRSTT